MRIPESIVLHIKKNDKNINHLDLSFLGLDDEAIDHLGVLLEDNINITSLNIQGNNITQEGANILAGILSLSAIDIRDNALGDEGVACLLNCKHLKRLQSSGSGASDDKKESYPDSLRFIQALDEKTDSLSEYPKFFRRPPKSFLEKCSHFFRR